MNLFSLQVYKEGSVSSDNDNKPALKVFYGTQTGTAKVR